MKSSKRSAKTNPFRDQVIALAKGEKPHLPVNDKEFIKCSDAIQPLTISHGEPLRLPSELLPPPI